MFHRANEDIRSAKGKITNWMIADKLGIHEVTFIRYMRKEMTETEKARVLSAIDEIKDELKGEN